MADRLARENNYIRQYGRPTISAEDRARMTKSVDPVTGQVTYFETCSISVPLNIFRREGTHYANFKL